MSLYKYKPDQKKREAGILVEVDTRGDYPVARVVKEVGKLPTFRLANATDQNPNWDKAYERIMRPYRAAKDKGELSEAELSVMFLDLWHTVFAEAGVLGWHNVPTEQGEPRAFSAKEALALMKEIPEVCDRLAAVAQDRKNFRIELPADPEADAKNS